MPGVPKDFAEHKLHVRADAKPVKQPLRRLSEEKRRIVGEEIARLLAAGFIMEVFFPEWLANPVLVLKKNNKWRMCIDYTSLNKACPKDPFALPRIDQVIDSTAGCELLSFLDAYSGYHQIKLDPADRLKNAFITPFGAFCYLTMTFGLRNAGATFQRCMQKCLLKQLGRNAHVYVDDIVVKTEKRGTLLEDLKETFANLRRFQIKLNPEKCVFGVPAGAHVYVDDIVVKTEKRGTLLEDLKETFANLRRFQIKLNPEKCVFGVPAGQLLGFLVSERGIECNPVKIKAIERMEIPTKLRDVQKFTGCLASLNRFISRLGEKALPLYRLMKKSTHFEWNDQADQAFHELKKMLTTPPVLAAQTEKEPMLLYIAATSQVVSESGIECNPVKIKAIERMEIPTKLRDVQKFTGCLASLNRFISRLGEKALPLY